MTTSNTVRERFIDAALCGGTYVGPPVVYVGLFVKGKAGDAREVEDASYARRPVKFAPTKPGGETWNVDTVEFARAGSDFGTVVEFALFDAERGGVELFRDALSAPQFVPAGAIMEFPARALHVGY